MGGNQKVLTLLTKTPSMRDDAIGWDWEVETDNVDLTKHVGLSSQGYVEHWPLCPLFAIAMGWRLMSAPVPEGDWYRWWFDRFN